MALLFTCSCSCVFTISNGYVTKFSSVPASAALDSGKRLPSEVMCARSRERRRRGGDAAKKTGLAQIHDSDTPVKKLFVKMKFQGVTGLSASVLLFSTPIRARLLATSTRCTVQLYLYCSTRDSVLYMYNNQHVHVQSRFYSCVAISTNV